jgi:hypothetical protein
MAFGPDGIRTGSQKTNPRHKLGTKSHLPANKLRMGTAKYVHLKKIANKKNLKIKNREFYFSLFTFYVFFVEKLI